MSHKYTFAQKVLIQHIAGNGHCATAQCGNSSFKCSLGPAGIRLNKREGDGATPAGEWPLLYVLYRPDRLMPPQSGLPVYAIKPDSGWCDDPASRLYNQPVSLPFTGSHEKLWRSDHLYDLIVVTGHNTSPVVAGFGSAVFIHLMRTDGAATQGCIAFARGDLLHLLKQWSTSSRIVIPA